jgi:phosphotransacetylase
MLTDSAIGSMTETSPFGSPPTSKYERLIANAKNVPRAQILIVPDLEAGNMLAKNLTFMAKADAAGIVLGARVPIILTSRADSVRSRLASCAAAVLYADARRRIAALPKA